MEVLLVLQIIVVVALIGVILVQKSSSDGFTGGSSPNSFLTGRASANLLTRTTAILATVFLVNSLILAYMASHSERAESIIDEAAKEVEGSKDSTTPAPTETPEPATPAEPVAPAVPAAE
jgi:preprotein translocase subunit SecG